MFTIVVLLTTPAKCHSMLKGSTVNGKSEYYFDGDINYENATAAILALEAGKKTLIISSYGGHENSALDLAFAIKKEHASIVVRGVCMSACALYLLPAAKNILIESGSIVAFHIGSSSIIKFVSKSDIVKFSDLETFAEINSNSERTKNLYNISRININLFDDVWKILSPICIIKKHLNVQSSVKLSISYWIPSRKYMEESGFKISGYWPESYEESNTISAKFLQNDTRYAFGYNKTELEKINFRKSIALCDVN